MILAARSRLYRSELLQVNTRWKALAEIDTMHSFAPLWNPKSKTGEKRTWPKQPRKKEKTRKREAIKRSTSSHSFAPFSNIKIFVKNCWKVCCFFQQKFANFVRNLLNFAKFLPIFFGIFPKCNIFLKIIIKLLDNFQKKCKNSKFKNLMKFS